MIVALAAQRQQLRRGAGHLVSQKHNEAWRKTRERKKVKRPKTRGKQSLWTEKNEQRPIPGTWPQGNKCAAGGRQDFR
jgi:hypothetical protein